MLIYNLPGRLPGEKIVKIIRKDLFILFKKAVLILLLIVLPVLVVWLMLNLFPNLLSGELAYPLLLLAVSAYVLFVWLFFFFSFIDYYLDVWLITSERIIDVRQEGFFSRTVAELKLSQIQDVASELEGFFQHLFKFGNVYVQTAGTTQRFAFRQIPNPEKVRDVIIKLAEQNKEQHKSHNL